MGVAKLNLGCGGDKKEGFINVDWNHLVDPDMRVDLNRIPYDFKDNSFECIQAFHVLEHLDDPFLVMKELHRILKPDGELYIKVPHFSRGFTHPEHKRSFDVSFPLYFNKAFIKFGYFGVDFELKMMKLHWLAAGILSELGYRKLLVAVLKVIDKIISFFANLNPAFCSRLWCFWVGGFYEIEFRFICRK